MPTNVETSGTYTLGMVFESSIPGWVLGVKFFKETNQTGTHIGSLWTIGGSLIGQVTFTNETINGWQTQFFSTPIPILANTLYVISYYSPNGTPAYVPGGGVGGFNTALTSGPLTAVANGTHANGLLATSNTFPTTSGAGADLMVDVIFDNCYPGGPNAPILPSFPDIARPAPWTANVIYSGLLSTVTRESAAFPAIAPSYPDIARGGRRTAYDAYVGLLSTVTRESIQSPAIAPSFPDFVRGPSRAANIAYASQILLFPPVSILIPIPLNPYATIDVTDTGTLQLDPAQTDIYAVGAGEIALDPRKTTRV